MSAIKINALATRVKLADIADNSNPERLKNLDEATANRLTAKYSAAKAALAAKPEKGGISI